MRYFHSVTISVFIKPEEDEPLIKSAFLSLFPFVLEQEKIPLCTRKAEGFNNRSIIILEVVLEKDRHIKEFVSSLVSRMTQEQCDLLCRQHNRLDDDLKFFIRLDKGKLMTGQSWITDEGDCVHIKLSVAAFPKKKEIAYGIIKGVFQKTL